MIKVLKTKVFVLPGIIITLILLYLLMVAGGKWIIQDDPQLPKIRSDYVIGCIQSTLVDEAKFAPKSNPEYLAIIDGCTASGWSL